MCRSLPPHSLASEVKREEEDGDEVEIIEEKRLRPSSPSPPPARVPAPPPPRAPDPAPGPEAAEVPGTEAEVLEEHAASESLLLLSAARQGQG